MNGPRFDSLTKLAAARTSRRTGLQAVLAVLSGGALSRLATVRPAQAATATGCDLTNCNDWALAQLRSCAQGCTSPNHLPDPACQAGCLSALSVDLAWCRQSGGCARTDGFAILLDGPGTTCMNGICCPFSKMNCGDGVCCSPDRCCGGASGHCCGDAAPYCVAEVCSECPTGFLSCPSGGGSICLDVVSSSNHCGSCDTACASGQECCTGVCVDGVTHCGGACVSNACPDSQPFDRETCHCACPSITCPSGRPQDPVTCACACPTRCPDGQAQDPTTCACACGGSTCAGSCCNGACTQLQSDPANCGGCGAACAKGQTCRNGQCTCAASAPDACAGICTDFRSDPGNCGGCSVGPNGSLYVCPGGGATPLPNCCGGICTNVSFDGDNCGGCGKACPDGKKCEQGTCACQAGSTVCAGRCVDLRRDSSNCGACGHACPAAEVCCNGACASDQSTCGDAVGVVLESSGPAGWVFRITAHACTGAMGAWNGTLVLHDPAHQTFPVTWTFPPGGTKTTMSVGPFSETASGETVTATFRFAITLESDHAGTPDTLVFDLAGDGIQGATVQLNDVYSNLGVPIPLTHDVGKACG